MPFTPVFVSGSFPLKSQFSVLEFFRSLSFQKHWNPSELVSTLQTCQDHPRTSQKPPPQLSTNLRRNCLLCTTGSKPPLSLLPAPPPECRQAIEDFGGGFCHCGCSLGLLSHMTVLFPFLCFLFLSFPLLILIHFLTFFT